MHRARGAKLEAKALERVEKGLCVVVSGRNEKRERVYEAE